MRADTTTDADHKDAPNATFDARATLEGRYDDATVRHAVEVTA